MFESDGGSEAPAAEEAAKLAPAQVAAKAAERKVFLEKDRDSNHGCCNALCHGGLIASVE